MQRESMHTTLAKVAHNVAGKSGWPNNRVALSDLESKWCLTVANVTSERQRKVANIAKRIFQNQPLVPLNTDSRAFVADPSRTYRRSVPYVPNHQQPNGDQPNAQPNAEGEKEGMEPCVV